MSYSPINSQIFAAAWGGALSSIGMSAVGGPILATDPQCVRVNQGAFAFAQALDTTWNNPVSDMMNFAAFAGATAIVLRDRGPYKNPTSDSFIDPNNWVTEAKTVIAMVLAGEGVASANGIAFPTFGGSTAPSIVSANNVKLLQGLAAVAQGDWQYLQPIDGVSNDVPRLQAALGRGPVVMQPGPANQQWQFNTATQWPSNSLCIGTANTVIQDNIGGGASVLTSPIASGYTEVNSGLTVVGNINLGAKTFVASGTIVIGKPFFVANAGLQGSIYFVRNSVAAGGGNFTITVDRPFLFFIPSGQAIQFLLNDFFPNRIYILGNGMTINSGTGGGVRVIEMLGLFNGLIQDLNINRNNGSPSSDFEVSMDVGSFGSIYRNIKLSNVIGAIGQVMESCEECTIDLGYVQNLTHVGATGIGISALDSSACRVTNSITNTTDIGFQQGTDGEQGCFDVTFDNCKSINATSTNADAAAFTITQGSTRAVLNNCSALFGANFGFHSFNDTAQPVGITMSNIVATGNVIGCKLSATVFHSIQGYECTNNTQCGLWVATGAFAVVKGLQTFDGNDSSAFVDGFGAAVFCDNNATLTLSDSFIRNTTGPVAGWSGVRGGRVAGGTAYNLTCTNVQIFQSTGSNSFGFDGRGNAANSGFMSLTNCLVQATGPSAIGVDTGTGVAYYHGIGNNFDAVTSTVLNINGAFNEVTFNAPGPTTFSFPVRNGAGFESWITTRAGTPQPLTIDNIVIGTSFRATGGGADTSTWKIKVL